MSDKFKRYGIPVREENTAIFKEVLDDLSKAVKNPNVESITMPDDTGNTTKIKTLITSLNMDLYWTDIYANPSLFDDSLLTAGATSAYCFFNFPCLIEGTEITLADKTRKKIEELKQGDIVLGYDPKTGTTCETVVISVYCTGVSTQFKCRQFSDGNRLLIYGKHKYYDPKAKHAAEFPAKEGFTALNENLEEVTCIANRFYSTYGTKTKRWNIITSNNTYFADGILCSFGAQDKYSYFLNRFKQDELPENIKEILLADCATVNDVYSVSADKEYLVAVASKINDWHKAYDETLDAKKKLAYYDSYAFERKQLSGEDAKKAEGRKAELAALVETKRAEYKRLDTEIAAIRKQYVKETPASAFEKCCERDNAALETFKAWLIPGYETPIKKGKKK